MTTTTQVLQGDIPDVLKPFYQGSENKPGLIERGVSAIYPGGLSGQAAYQAQYAPVIQAGLMGSGSIAGLSPFQTALGQQLGSMTTPGQYQLGTQAGQAAASGLQGLQGFQAAGVSAPQLTTFQLGSAPTVGPSALTTFQMNPARQFSSEEAKAYMSPYMQSVVDQQQQNAITAAQKAQLGQNLAAARQGTYGGARQAILQGERESGLRTQLAGIQAQGLQSAFEQAQQQFERDRAAQMGVGAQNLQAALGVQQLGAGQDLQSQLANQAARQAYEQANLQSALGVQQLGAGQNLAAQQANQQAGLQAAQTRLGAAQGLGGLAGMFGQLGTQQLAGQLDLLKTQGAFGDLQRNIQQQQMDAQRQYLIDQAQYGQTQVGQLSNLLRGIPMQASTQTTTTPPPSFASQLTGLGLTGIGLYNMLGGGKG